MRLRELNKLRTREAIVGVAADLFVERGYRKTTLAQISKAAGIAPSTLHAYFPVKEDLVFSILEVVTSSARERLLERDGGETAADAIPAWVAEDLPGVLTLYGADGLVHLHDVMASDPDLWIQRRFRLTLLQEVFAAAFASDPGEEESPLRAKVMAAITLHAIEEVFDVWYAHHASDSNVALAELTTLTTSHVRLLLEGCAKRVDVLPESTPGALDLHTRRRAATRSKPRPQR